ncbi:MAG: reverse transcriptase domain-containing protein, partial [Bacteroidota bacterium]
MKRDTPERRKQIREEIKKTSRQAFIMKEMKRLGFWPNTKDKPTLQEQLIERRTTLQQEIRELSKKNNRYENREAALNQYKKERLRKSKEQQKLNKQKRKEAHEAKQVQRREAMGKDIHYLGKRYSHLLKETQCDQDALAKNQLGHIHDVASLSNALGISVYDLRFLAYDRKLSKHSHYITYGIKKKSGGIRKISAPKPKLKKVQRAILENILYKMLPSKYAHGFVKDKSIVSNALPHMGSSIVINMDLQDFFPTIDYPRVFGFFKSIGFSPQ